MAQKYLLNEIYNNENCDAESADDLCISAMACYPFPYMSMLEDNDSTWIDILSFPDETRDHKKLRRTITTFADLESKDSCCIGRSSSSLSSMPGQNFRDHISTYNQRYLAAEAVEEAAAAAAIINAEEEDGSADGMKLVRLLIACAEAVACRDRSHASVLLSELRANALVHGSSFQRVASCFVQGLADRLALVQPFGAVGFAAPIMNIMDVSTEKKEEAFTLVYENCPNIQFGHFVANETILEAFEGESFFHVVDLGMTLGLAHGRQWRGLIDGLANRGGGQPPCHLRITSVGLSVDRFQIIGDELKSYAKRMGIKFEFSVVKSNLENLQPQDIKVFEGEVLVVNSILQLHCVVKESRGALNSVLQLIHKFSPRLLVLVEQDSSHNGPFFLG